MPVGIGDDAAVVEPERNSLEVVTVDALVDGVHFDRRFTPPEAIGHRALAVSLSDLAAMGAAPRFALLSCVLPPALPLPDFEAFVSGFTALAASCRLHLAGGNLTRSPGPMMVDVTVVGTVKRRRALTRGGARPGDEIFVTGVIGAAAAGLQMLQQNGTPPPAAHSCVTRYLFPVPRVRTGLLLGRNRAASACMDLSDGLADAVRQVAAASGVGAVIDADAIPIDEGARTWFTARGADPVIEAISGGDDYELLFTVGARRRGRLRAARNGGAVTLTRIGVCTGDARVVLRRRGAADEPLPPGFHHFR
jgi:thiamine-monophosphate kinase